MSSKTLKDNLEEVENVLGVRNIQKAGATVP